MLLVQATPSPKQLSRNGNGLRAASAGRQWKPQAGMYHIGRTSLRALGGKVNSYHILHASGGTRKVRGGQIQRSRADGLSCVVSGAPIRRKAKETRWLWKSRRVSRGPTQCSRADGVSCLYREPQYKGKRVEETRSASDTALYSDPHTSSY